MKSTLRHQTVGQLRVEYLKVFNQESRRKSRRSVAGGGNFPEPRIPRSDRVGGSAGERVSLRGANLSIAQRGGAEASGVQWNGFAFFFVAGERGASSWSVNIHRVPFGPSTAGIGRGLCAESGSRRMDHAPRGFHHAVSARSAFLNCSSCEVTALSGRPSSGNLATR